jgi:hypothetical protein
MTLVTREPVVIVTLLLAMACAAAVTWHAAASPADSRRSTQQRAAPNITIVVDRIWPTATPAFKFARVPSPAKDDAATNAKRLLVDGEMDPNGATLAALTDGLLPREEDEPGANFFFDAGTSGGSFRFDLGQVMTVTQINSYSWHPNTRGPQVYAVYGSDGSAAAFNPAPKGGVDPAAVGWTWIASIDTRPGTADMGGQYGVSISASKGAVGRFQHLLFVCAVTETDDDYGNTFYSEIDVIAKAS